MISEAGLQRAFLAVGSIGRWEYLLHLSCFLVYSDLMLVIGKDVCIGDIDLEWLRANASSGTVLVLIVGYALTKSFLLPVIDVLYKLAVVFPFVIMRLEHLAQHEVDIRAWWAYALLTRNTPAYREAEKIKAKNEAREENADDSRHLGVLLIADWVVGRFMGNSLMYQLLTFIHSFQDGRRHLLLIALVLFLVVLAFNALISPLGARLSVSVDNTSLRRDVTRALNPTPRNKASGCDGDVSA